jgi:hypothetical protein
MPKILIFDPLQHFPSLFKILQKEGYNVKYKAIFSSQMAIRYKIYGGWDRFKHIYQFLPTDVTNEIDQVYDLIVLVLPVCETREPDKMNDLIKFCLNFLTHNNLKLAKKILIDNSDDKSDPLLIKSISDFGFDRILKRETSVSQLYSKKVEPFPFVIFGLVDPIFLWQFNSQRTKLLKSKKVIWIGNNSSLSRAKTLEIIKHKRYSDSFRIIEGNKTFEMYKTLISRSSYFLNLKGEGDICKRLFEGIAFGSIPITERLDVLFPPEFKDFEKLLNVFSFDVQTLDKLISNINDLTRAEVCEISKIFQNVINTKQISDFIIKF